MNRFASLLALPLFFGALSPAVTDENVTIAEKKNNVLTPSLQQLAAGAQQAADVPVGEGPGSVLQKPSGRILVDVRLENTSPNVLESLRAAGGRITFVDRTMQTATVAVRPADLKALAAADPAIISVLEVVTPMTNAACPSGDFVSEGVTQLKAALARSQFGVDGTGITVGVLSDSYDRAAGAATDVTNGELPGVTNPCGNSSAVGNLAEGPSGADEGRAMAQIVHDVAPKAKILFATAFAGQPAFAQSIRDLAAQGADVIVDDVSYFTEPMYQDGVVAKAVNDVTANGVAYFSSAANSNTIIGGRNVASYEAAAFRPTTCPAIVATHYGSASISCHDFDPGPGIDALYGFTYNGTITYSLGWSEPQNGVATDLDLCLLNAAGSGLSGCAETANRQHRTSQ